MGSPRPKEEGLGIAGVRFFLYKKDALPLPDRQCQSTEGNKAVWNVNGSCYFCDAGFCMVSDCRRALPLDRVK